jgi:hypothetical protein
MYGQECLHPITDGSYRRIDAISRQLFLKAVLSSFEMRFGDCGKSLLNYYQGMYLVQIRLYARHNYGGVNT